MRVRVLPYLLEVASGHRNSQLFSWKRHGHSNLNKARGLCLLGRGGGGTEKSIQELEPGNAEMPQETSSRSQPRYSIRSWDPRVHKFYPVLDWGWAPIFGACASKHQHWMKIGSPGESWCKDVIPTLVGFSDIEFFAFLCYLWTLAGTPVLHTSASNAGIVENARCCGLRLAMGSNISSGTLSTVLCAQQPWNEMTTVNTFLIMRRDNLRLRWLLLVYH